VTYRQSFAPGPECPRFRPHAFALLALLVACDTPQAEQASVYPVLFRSVSEEGEPLPGVQVLSGGEALGITGPEASLSLQLQGREGSEVSFEPRCPQGTKPLGEPAALRLRTLGNGPAPEVELGCGRDKRMAALIVSAPGFADLPVLVHEREVTRTDESGTAHLLLEGEQNTPLRVVLDTGARPRIVPPSPHKDVHIGTRDEIVVFTPGLVEPPAPVKKKHVKKAKAPPPTFRPEKL
jgi:hypothetical protein